MGNDTGSMIVEFNDGTETCIEGKEEDGSARTIAPGSLIRILLCAKLAENLI